MEVKNPFTFINLEYFCANFKNKICNKQQMPPESTENEIMDNDLTIDNGQQEEQRQQDNDPASRLLLQVSMQCFLLNKVK